MRVRRRKRSARSLFAGSPTQGLPRGGGPLFRRCHRVVCSHSWTRARPGAPLRQKMKRKCPQYQECLYCSLLFCFIFFVSYKLERPPWRLVRQPEHHYRPSNLLDVTHIVYGYCLNDTSQRIPGHAIFFCCLIDRWWQLFASVRHVRQHIEIVIDLWPFVLSIDSVDQYVLLSVWVCDRNIISK